MKRYLKKMHSCNKQIDKIMREFCNAIAEMVKAHGGFIELWNSNHDNAKHDKIYGYALDGEFDELHEYNMLALMLNEENELMCFLAPKYVGVNVKYTKEDMLNKENKDMWYWLDGTDAYLYAWPTLVDMMGTITEYDD